MFQPEKETSQSSSKREKKDGEHKVNMVELNSNSFRLDFSLSSSTQSLSPQTGG